MINLKKLDSEIEHNIPLTPDSFKLVFPKYFRIRIKILYRCI